MALYVPTPQRLVPGVPVAIPADGDRTAWRYFLVVTATETGDLAQWFDAMTTTVAGPLDRAAG